MPQYISKIILNGVTQMDVTQDTVAANNLLSGETATKNDGSSITGTYVPFTPSGNINITQAGVTDVTNYATATVPTGSLYSVLPIENDTIDITVDNSGVVDAQLIVLDGRTVTPVTTNGWLNSSTTMELAIQEYGTYQIPEAEVTPVLNTEFDTYQGNRRCVAQFGLTVDTAGFMTEGDYFDDIAFNAVPYGTTVTPSNTIQTVGDENWILEGPVTVNAMPIANPLVDATSSYSTVSGQRKWSFTPNASAGVHYGYDAGYFEGTIVGNEIVYNAIDSNTTITPTESAQTIGGANYMMEGAVTVNAIPSNYVGSGITRRSSSDLTNSLPSGKYRFITPAGYYAEQATKDISAYELPTPTISINETTGVITATNYLPNSGFVNTATKTTTQQLILKDSTDLTVNGATITAPAGYYANSASKTMPTGVTTSPTSISGTAATVSTGTNTLTLTKTVSVTPRVTTAGYVSAGTAGNSSVSLTANVTTKAAATITPGTSNQTIASGTYLTGTQTISGDADLVAGNIKTGVNIFGVAGSYTADATATADDILSGQTAYVNGSKLTGTLEVQNFYTGSSTPAANFGNNGDLYLQVTT